MKTDRFTDLRDAGYQRRTVDKMIKTGELHTVRHGGYGFGEPSAEPRAQHRALIRTTLPLLRDRTILSHVSAGLIWDLPVPYRLLTRVHITRETSNGKVGNWLHSHRLSLGKDEIDVHDGLVVTSLARTVSDLCRLTAPHEALAIMDAGWRKLGSLDAVAECVDQAVGRVGIANAKWALAHADPLSESPGESISRYWMIRAGIPAPVLQFEVRNGSGNLLGRADFGWPDLGLLGEFDGRIKYDELVPDGLTAADVIMSEKHRENQFRNEGYWVFRWGWRDLHDGLAFMSYLEERITKRSQARRGI